MVVVSAKIKRLNVNAFLRLFLPEGGITSGDCWRFCCLSGWFHLCGLAKSETHKSELNSTLVALATRYKYHGMIMVNFFETSCLLLYPRNAVFSLTSKNHPQMRRKVMENTGRSRFEVRTSILQDFYSCGKICMAKHSNAMAVRNPKTMEQMRILALLLKELERERWQLALETKIELNDATFEICWKLKRTWVCKTPEPFQMVFPDVIVFFLLSFSKRWLHTLIKEFTWARKGKRKRNSKGRERKE